MIDIRAGTWAPADKHQLIVDRASVDEYRVSPGDRLFGPTTSAFIHLLPARCLADINGTGGVCTDSATQRRGAGSCPAVGGGKPTRSNHGRRRPVTGHADLDAAHPAPQPRRDPGRPHHPPGTGSRGPPAHQPLTPKSRTPMTLATGRPAHAHHHDPSRRGCLLGASEQTDQCREWR